MKKLKLFITYSHGNKKEKDRIIIYLKVMRAEGLISVWHDDDILGGDKWQEEIFSKHLPNSDILLYLVSSSSIVSENCNKELEIALAKGIRVIPIILEACDWKSHLLGKFQAFPEKGLPINEWTPKSKGFQSVVEGLRKVVEAEMESSFDALVKNITYQDIFQNVLYWRAVLFTGEFREHVLTHCPDLSESEQKRLIETARSLTHIWINNFKTLLTFEDRAKIRLAIHDFKQQNFELSPAFFDPNATQYDLTRKSPVRCAAKANLTR
ncbi:MAG: toll/interleukin-1 receptor domain-containing protein [Candidatus Poribacteria bacterium]|nr:toll/interleukin-1 receptor domain-containing protein [Candidatus Poribacteria bacterium]